MENTELDRLKRVIDFLKKQEIIDNQGTIATDLGYKREGTISEIVKGKTPLTDKFVKAFASKYHVEEEFIRTGEGLMFKPEANINEDESQLSDPHQSYGIVKPDPGQIRSLNGHAKHRKPGKELIPYYEADFMAGASGEFYNESALKPAYYMDIPEFRGCTAFRAYSDSMEKLITSGNILFGLKLDDWQSHLEYGQIYGIIMKDNRRYLKYLKLHKENEENYFLARSENAHFDDMNLPKNKIKTLWLIDGWLTRNT